MIRIEGAGGVREPQPTKPAVAEKPKAEVAKVKQTPNAAVRAELRDTANQRRQELNERYDRDRSALIAATAGATAGQFAAREAAVRNSGTIKIRENGAGTTDFVNKVGRDLDRIAPGTRVVTRPTDPKDGFIWDKKYGAGTAAVVETAPVGGRTSGHDAGYRLVDQLKNNPNDITIAKYPGVDNAFAQPLSNNSAGTVTKPGKGGPVEVQYNPDAPINLPVRDANGKLASVPTDPALILGHELNHASHMQRGTQDIRPGDGGKKNVFSIGDQNFVEQNHKGIRLREEFRTVGMDGYNYGKEPSENRLRTELQTNDRRISYQHQNAHVPISPAEAAIARTATRAQTFADGVVDGVRGSRNSAVLGAGFGAVTALASGKDAKGVATDAAVGAGTGVTQEVIERVVNGPRAATSGMTASSFRAAATQVKGAAVAGAVINTGFAIYDQVDNLKNDATRSKAIGTIAGEAAVGAASGAAGAYAGAMAGAAIGSIVPGVGTVIGGVAGFAVGAAAGYLADKGLRGIGVDKLVGKGVSMAYDGAANAVKGAKDMANSVVDGAKNLFGGATHKLASIFG